MIAYNRTILLHLQLLKKAKQWHARQLLSAEQLSAISEKYKVNLYTPNLFIKVGLFVFTWVCILAVLLLYGLLFLQAFESMGSAAAVGITCVLFATACIFLLETLIRKKRLYRSGIDEALLYAAVLFACGAVASLLTDPFSNNNTMLVYVAALLPLLAAAIIRYADALVSLAFSVCCYSLVFLLVLKLGDVAKLIMPFVLMLLSVCFFITVKKCQRMPQLYNWRIPIGVVECVGILFFYLSGNYYVIRESGVHFFAMQLSAGKDIPLAIVFYLFTAIVPFVYVVYGLKQKDRLLLWIGLATIALSAATFKYYFGTKHPEVLLIIAGVIVIAVAYTAMKYLQTPKHGITLEEDPHENNFLQTNAEALLQAKSFGQSAQSIPVKHNTEFGGGSSGGGGATEEW